METQDYKEILDSLRMVGIYVIREDNHQVLYFNQWVKEMSPTARIGMICNELWPGSCSGCPLLSIGDKKEIKSVLYNGPFDNAMDIIATRIMWKESIPAFLITLSPHVDAANFTYHMILRADLTADNFESIKMMEEINGIGHSCVTLSQYFYKLVENGSIYINDIKRFQEFTKIENLRKELKKEKKMLICTYRFKTEKGYRWQTMEIVPDYNYTEDRQTVMLYIKDVDDIYREGLELEAFNIRNLEIMKSRYSVITTVYLDTGIYERVYLNQQEEIGNIQKGNYDSYIQKAAEEEIHEDDIDKFLATLSLDNLKKKAEKTVDYTEMTVQYRRKGPSVKWVEEQILLVRRKKNVLINILGRDITEKKLKEAADTREKKAKTQIINSLSSLFFATYYIDLEADTFRMATQLDEVGDVLGTVVNYSKGIVTYAQHFIHPDNRKEYLEKLCRRNLLEQLSPEHPFLAVEYHRIKEDEDGVTGNGWIRATVILAETENGVPKKAVYVAQDVTEIKEKEEREHKILKDACEAANQANASKSEFLSRVSHDIRTPLNAIIGMTAIAGTHLEEQDRIADCLNKISVSSTHLLSLINEVLDMSKIESGKINLAEEEFNLSNLIQNLHTMILPAVQAKQHRLEFHIGRVEHEDVIGDVMRLQQVFMNILGNAVKYTPAGGRLEMELSEKPSKIYGYGCYEFIFQDNGIGMSEEFLKQIFEPFSRAEDTRINKIEGTGLGMTITQNIVRMMNGDIHVESKINEGSRFFVTLYLKHQNMGIPDTESFANLSILVADNDICSCQAVCGVLKDLGMKSEWVSCGADAVNRVLEAHHNGEDFFALIINQEMPETDGIEIAKKLRKEIGPEAPIIILSSYDLTNVEAEEVRAGIAEFISKPLFKSKLIYLFKKLTGNESNKENSSVKLSSGQSFHGKRILLVDDIEINREIAEEIIGSTRVTVETAADGKQALEMLKENDEWYYDMIFMDIQMPVMNGYEATEAIRKLERADAGRIPIIAMTANAFTEDVIASRKAGMNEHIAKPLNVEQLMDCMGRWLKQRNDS